MNLPARISLLTALLAGATASGADELGRVFFTPEQRASLAQQQLQGDHPGNSSRTLMVNGIVQRHGGDRTVWINGIPQHIGAGSEKAPESVTIPIPDQLQPARVKVGQRLVISPAAETVE